MPGCGSRSLEIDGEIRVHSAPIGAIGPETNESVPWPSQSKAFVQKMTQPGVRGICGESNPIQICRTGDSRTATRILDPLVTMGVQSPRGARGFTRAYLA